MRSGSCPRQQTPPMAVCRSKNRVSFVLLPVVLALVLLSTIAFASPPDPLWIPGIYDSADGDEIVNLVYETSAASAAASSCIGPLPSMPGIPFERITPRLPGSRFAQKTRDPPAVGSKVSVNGFTFRACSRLIASRMEFPLRVRRSPSSGFCQETGARLPMSFRGAVIPARAATRAILHCHGHWGGSGGRCSCDEQATAVMRPV